MPINVLPKNTPRGRGPEPTQIEPTKPASTPASTLDNSREAELAAKEAQELWESQEIGNTSWSGEGGNRYSDPN